MFINWYAILSKLVNTTGIDKEINDFKIEPLVRLFLWFKTLILFIKVVYNKRLINNNLNRAFLCFNASRLF